MKYIEQFKEEREPINGVGNIMRSRVYEELDVPSFTDRTRASLKIQEGCNNFCTFCIIPYAATNQGFGGAGSGDFGGFGDIFDMFFGGGGGRRNPNAPRQGADLQYTMTVEFKEAVFGKDTEIEIPREENCTTCDGSGAKPGTKPETCSHCQGSGQMSVEQNTPFGRVVNRRVCHHCEKKQRMILQMRTPDKLTQGKLSSNCKWLI